MSFMVLKVLKGSDFSLPRLLFVKSVVLPFLVFLEEFGTLFKGNCFLVVSDYAVFQFIGVLCFVYS